MTMQRLIHYSAAPLTSVYSIPLEQQSSHRKGLHKPVGLWVSVEGDGDWKEWCEGEQWGLDRLACSTAIEIAPSANILRLQGEDALLRFHDEYSVVAHRYGVYVKTAIQWPKVAEKFDGIIIAPYIWSCRLETGASDWYYGWDCASGCIWNAQAIAELRPIEQAKAA